MTIQDRLRNNIIDVKSKYDSGITMREIAKEYDCNSGTVHHFLKQYNYLRPSKQVNRIKDYADKIIELFNSGMSVYSISKEVNINNTSVNRFLKNQGMNTTKRSTQRKDGDKVLDHKDMIIQLYNEGNNQSQIAKLIGCGQPSIYNLLKSENIETRNNTIHSVDETYFNNIDTQEKAYILGWMYSDGCVSVEGKFRIQIQSEDDYILHWIKEQIKYTGPMYDIKPPKRFPHRKNQTCLCVNRKAMTDDLIRHGCVPNKSLILEFPHNLIGEDLMVHFIRGFFDGDGCITDKTVNITSTDTFNTELNKYLIEKIGLEGGRQEYRWKNTNTTSLKFRRPDTKILLDWLYKDSTIHLERKYQRYKELSV